MPYRATLPVRSKRGAVHDAADGTRGRPERPPRAGAGLALGLIGEPMFGETLRLCAPPIQTAACEPAGYVRADVCMTFSTPVLSNASIQRSAWSGVSKYNGCSST